MNNSIQLDDEALDRANKLFNILVNNQGIIEKIYPWHSIYEKYLGKKLDALWDNNPDYLYNLLDSEINSVIQSGEPRISSLQPGCIPAYNSKINYWECSIYPIVSKENINNVLIRLEDVTTLINMSNQIEAIVKNFVQPFRKREDLKTANRDLKYNEENYQLLIENITDYAIYMLDARGLIITWNRGAETTTQFKKEDVIGKHFSILYTPEDRKANHPKDLLSLTIANGRYEEERYKIKKDGSIYWSNCVLHPVFNNDHVLIGIGVIAQDLTKNKELDKLKNEFISIIDHELKTPVTVIKGSLSLLEELELSPQRKKKLLASCTNNCDRLIRLIENILDLKQLNDGKMFFNFKKLNLKKLIEEAIELNVFFSEKHNIPLVADGLEDIYILGDADRLIQVLNNLMQNAIKYSLPNAAVTIKMSQINKEVLVEVIDQGCGLTKQFNEIIFKKFTQMDSTNTRNHEGAGLGLPISRAIIEKHQGILDFKSELNKGSTFYFQLPVWSELA
jgi:PAS domain S-box-containing protein